MPLVEASLGASTTVTLVVSDDDLAPTLGSGDVPVLGTPRLIALCEEATVAAVAPLLEDGETTVGTLIEFRHLVPSPPGARVEAEATLQTVEGTRLTFAVEARQGDVLVGGGRIGRVVVDRRRFVADLPES